MKATLLLTLTLLPVTFLHAEEQSNTPLTCTTEHGSMFLVDDSLVTEIGGKPVKFKVVDKDNYSVTGVYEQEDDVKIHTRLVNLSYLNKVVAYSAVFENGLLKSANKVDCKQ
ncbi:hypothetical protein K7103_004358 [Vibrio parahaemolyticus]|nr:hypothetical protein [Vibrio parahaemolyticus]